MYRMIPTLTLFVGLIISTFPSLSFGGDWPTWRADSKRTAKISESLPLDLNLLWSRDLGAPKPCWPFTQYKLQFDRSYEPIVQGNRLFVGSMAEDSVTAYDTATGEEIWKTIVGGPVRFAPVAWKDHLYFVSDDGHLYCAKSQDGKIQWKVRGGPSDHRIFGNERLVSMWPARGGPVLYDGTVYFAASIWPFMGVYIHAVDAESGTTLWSNSGSSSSYILQPHSSPAFAGIAPQGYLAASEDKLFVAGGRSVPAVYDRLTGELLYYDANTKYGGYEVTVADDYHCTFGVLFNSEDGETANFQFAKASVAEGTSVIESQMPIRPQAFGSQNEGMIRSIVLEPETKRITDRRGRTKKVLSFPVQWELKKPVNRVFFKAGSMIFCGTNGMVAAVSEPEHGTGVPQGEEEPEVPMTSDFAWQTSIDGDPFTAIAADNKLFVVTKEGQLYCYGGESRDPSHHSHPQPEFSLTDEWTNRAQEILSEVDATGGYAVVLGAGTGQLAEALVKTTDLQVIVYEPDSKKVDSLKDHWSEQGIYGRRITLVSERITDSPVSPYFASVITSENLSSMKDVDPGKVAKVVFDCLRPYGGKAILPFGGDEGSEFESALAEADLPNAEWRTLENGLVLTKAGSLPGSAPWTHQYGDVGNTVFSKDQLVKAPLGILWFGGPSHLDVLPRHGHGPPQQIIGGRLFIQGIQVLSARDVYTGRILWRKELPNLNTFDMYYSDSYVDDPYDLTYNQRHIPGANQYGTNFIATADSLYLIMEEHCLVIDPVTGDTVKIFELPEISGVNDPNWGYIGIYEDYLIAGAVPQHVDEDDSKLVLQTNNRFGVGSKHLIVMDRHSGEVHWTHEADSNFRHNTIVAGNGKVFCMDSISKQRLSLLKRRGLAPRSNPTIHAFDISTGEEIWKTEDNVFGTWLSYSAEQDVLFQGGSDMGDRADDEVGQGMAAYNGTDGGMLWQNDLEYGGPCILYHDWVITQTGGSNTHAPPAMAFNIHTGERIMTPHPVTGDPVPWSWVRFKGCNTAIACENLLTFRSASAAFVDLTKNLGTSTLGGFRSGCTSNLVAADGILNAPDYTRTCTCAYQNQTSLALVHMPEDFVGTPTLEGWSFNFYPSPEKPTPIQHVGINLGAPGDRMDPDGTFWLEFPSVGGPSPELSIDLKSDHPELYRNHASEIEKNESTNEGSPQWVAASGFEGAATLTIHPYLFPSGLDEEDIQGFEKNAHTPDLMAAFETSLATPTQTLMYKIRLHFAETEDIAPGDRVFDVVIQGKKVLENFDVVKEAKGLNRGISRELSGVEITGQLIIELVPSVPESKHLPILSGIELISEGAPDPLDS